MRLVHLRGKAARAAHAHRRDEEERAAVREDHHESEARVLVDGLAVKVLVEEEGGHVREDELQVGRELHEVADAVAERPELHVERQEEQ